MDIDQNRFENLTDFRRCYNKNALQNLQGPVLVFYFNWKLD